MNILNALEQLNHILRKKICQMTKNLNAQIHLFIFSIYAKNILWFNAEMIPGNSRNPGFKNTGNSRKFWSIGRESREFDKKSRDFSRDFRPGLIPESIFFMGEEYSKKIFFKRNHIF